MATLSLLDDNGVVVARWEIGAKPMSIGRDNSADVKIEDDSLSRRHFMIAREGKTYQIQDLNSQNGTWVDGKRERVVKLRESECIVAGRSLFMFNEHTLAAAAPKVAMAALAKAVGLSAAV